jgi:hypothetical protein
MKCLEPSHSLAPLTLAPLTLTPPLSMSFLIRLLSQ